MAACAELGMLAVLWGHRIDLWRVPNSLTQSFCFVWSMEYRSYHYDAPRIVFACPSQPELILANWRYRTIVCPVSRNILSPEEVWCDGRSQDMASGVVDGHPILAVRQTCGWTGEAGVALYANHGARGVWHKKSWIPGVGFRGALAMSSGVSHTRPAGIWLCATDEQIKAVRGPGEPKVYLCKFDGSGKLLRKFALCLEFSDYYGIAVADKYCYVCFRDKILRVCVKTGSHDVVYMLPRFHERDHIEAACFVPGVGLAVRINEHSVVSNTRRQRLETVCRDTLQVLVSHRQYRFLHMSRERCAWMTAVARGQLWRVL
jgi:hypothetical protein